MALRVGLGVAGQGGDFDDGVGELAHGADEEGHDFAVELGVGAALEFGEGFGGGAPCARRGSVWPRQ